MHGPDIYIRKVQLGDGFYLKILLLLRKICTNIQAQRSMKQSYYNFCNKIVQIPLIYGEERCRNKKYPKNYKKEM